MKKRADMTPMERMEYIMTDATWDDGETVGHDIKQGKYGLLSSQTP